MLGQSSYLRIKIYSGWRFQTQAKVRAKVEQGLDVTARFPWFLWWREATMEDRSTLPRRRTGCRDFRLACWTRFINTCFRFLPKSSTWRTSIRKQTPYGSISRASLDFMLLDLVSNVSNLVKQSIGFVNENMLTKKKKRIAEDPIFRIPGYKPWSHTLIYCHAWE